MPHLSVIAHDRRRAAAAAGLWGILHALDPAQLSIHTTLYEAAPDDPLLSMLRQNACIPETLNTPEDGRIVEYRPAKRPWHKRRPFRKPVKPQPLEWLFVGESESLAQAVHPDRRYLAASSAIAERLVTGGVAPDNVFVLPVLPLTKLAALDDTRLTRLKRRVQARSNDHFLLVWRALEPGSDMAVVLRSLKRLETSLPHLKLLAIGDGPDRNYFESLALSFGLAGRVHIFDSDAPIAELLTLADLFIDASDGAGPGAYALSAMQAGRPVLTARHSGWNDLGTGTGLRILPRMETPELAEAVQALIDDPKHRSMMGAQARAFTQTLPDPATVTRRLLRFLQP